MAKLAGKKTISLDEISQEINLRKYLGKKPTQDELDLFADVAVEVINDRTLDGKTIHGTKFKKYSKEYAAFKGVSRSSVDLFLDGDMLDAIKASGSEDDGIVKIKVDGKDVDTKKAFNHQTGDTLPKRQFFGVTTSEARDIADAMKESIDLVNDNQEQLIASGAKKKTAKQVSLAELELALEQLGIEQIE